jgi:hypothetical protein
MTSRLLRIAADDTIETMINAEKRAYPNFLLNLKMSNKGKEMRIKKISDSKIDIHGRHFRQSVCIFLTKNQICHMKTGQSFTLLMSHTLSRG